MSARWKEDCSRVINSISVLPLSHQYSFRESSSFQIFGHSLQANGPKAGYSNLPMERGGDEPGRRGGIHLRSGRVHPTFSDSASSMGTGGVTQEVKGDKGL